MSSHHQGAALAPCAPLPRTHLLAIVQPLASGDARQYIRKQGPLPPYLICHVMQQVCSALAHMHALQLCHGDLKLDNVLLGPSLQAWLADLGSAFFLGTHTTTDYLQLPHHVCTEPYRAPEVVDSRRYSAASDVWAVGLMLAELAQGRLCYVTKPSPHPTTMSQGGVGSRVLPAPQPLPQRYVSWQDLAQGLSWDQTQQQLTASEWLSLALSGWRPPCPTSSSSKYVLRQDLLPACPRLGAVVRRCLAANPYDRPSAAQLDKELGALGHQLLLQQRLEQDRWQAWQ
ncbi:kinase-like domain-containing protein [Haematococcus lacustris]